VIIAYIAAVVAANVMTYHRRYFRNPLAGAARCSCGSISVAVPGCVSDISDDEARGLAADLQRALGTSRGALIVAEASAGARVVDAREALIRTPAHRVADHEHARARLSQAEREHVAARAALEARGGR
jgi:hypothetical protein